MQNRNHSRFILAQTFITICSKKKKKMEKKVKHIGVGVLGVILFYKY